QLLNPLPSRRVPAEVGEVFEELSQRHSALRGVAAERGDGSLQYRIVQDEMPETEFYSFAFRDNVFVLVLNPRHPFFRKVYQPRADREDREGKALRGQFDLFLLAAARAEAEATRGPEREALLSFRKTWSDNLATFLNG